MKVSVAMCTYNGRPFIGKQIQSILRQTKKPDEIIICDDGSKDGTMEILKKYEGHNPKIINIFENESNLGITKNFERAIKKCSGDVIAISDQDDIWRPQKLELQLNKMGKNKINMIFHNSTIVDEKLNRISDLWSMVNYSFQDFRDIDEAFKKQTIRQYIQGASILFDSNLRKHIVPIPKIWPYDHYIPLIASITGYIFDIDKELIKWRQHNEQETGLPERRGLKEKLENFMNTDPSIYDQEAEKWSILKNSIQSLNQDNLIVAKENIMTEINNRVEYMENRRAIHTDGPMTEKLRKFSRNIYKKYYNRYTRDSAYLVMMKDIFSLINII